MAQKLFDRIGTYWEARSQNGKEGLVLLDECIRRVASKDRDWDALARFLSMSAATNNGMKVKKIIRAAFGNSLTYVTDKTHPAGGRFALGWEGPFNLKGSNSYGVVTKAIVDGLTWDDRKFMVGLGEVIPDLPKKVKPVDQKAQDAAAKRLAKSLTALRAAGYDIGQVIHDAQTEMAKAVVVVNGIKVAA